MVTDKHVSLLPGNASIGLALASMGQKSMFSLLYHVGLCTAYEKTNYLKDVHKKGKAVPFNLMEYGNDCKSCKEQVDELLRRIDEGDLRASVARGGDGTVVTDANHASRNEYLYVLNVPSLVIDNVNRVFSKELARHKHMEDLISVILVLIEFKVTYNELLALKEDNYQLVTSSS